MSDKKVLPFPSKLVNEADGSHLAWDGSLRTGIYGEGSFHCDTCTNALAFVPFADKVHGAPERVFYCDRCCAIVPPEKSLPKVQTAIEWMQEVEQMLRPQLIDREELPKHRDPRLATGLVTPDGQDVDTLRRD